MVPGMSRGNQAEEACGRNQAACAACTAGPHIELNVVAVVDRRLLKGQQRVLPHVVPLHLAGPRAAVPAGTEQVGGWVA
jgi:hypothetical protein